MTSSRSGPPSWGLAVFFYVLLDGFDLGVGILYGFAEDAASRSLMINSIAPVWDGNETWLGSAEPGLLAAFPLAFAIIIPALYFPILIMLLALVFRGVAFEFRRKGRGAQEPFGPRLLLRINPCDLCPGRRAGRLYPGISCDRPAVQRRIFRLLHPLFDAHRIALSSSGYGLLGAGWLVLKTEGVSAGKGAPPWAQVFSWAC